MRSPRAERAARSVSSACELRDARFSANGSPAEVVNYGKYIKDSIVSECPSSSSIEDCFGTDNDEQFLAHDLSQTWRLWLFQVCTQWGYFMPAPLDGPSIVSSK